MEQFLKDKFQKQNWTTKILKEISVVIGGKDATKEQIIGKYPALRTEDMSSEDFDYSFNKCISFVDKNLIKNPKYFKEGDILMNSINNIGKISLYKGNEKCIFGNNIYKISQYQGDSRYLSYALSTKKVKNQINELITKSSSPKLYIENARKINIIYPPIETQREISDILDKFVEIEKCLMEELKNHRKQYQYYLDEIFKKELEKYEIKEKKSLYEIGNFVLGNINKYDWSAGDQQILRRQDINQMPKFVFDECISGVDLDLIIEDKRYFSHGDILITSTDSNVCKNKVLLYLGNKKCLMEREIFAFKHNQNPKYLYFALCCLDARNQLNRIKENITKKDLEKIQIPLPDINIQNDISNKIEEFHRIFSEIEKSLKEYKNNNRKSLEFYIEEIISI